MAEETQAAMCYPRSDQYETWKERADEMDMSVSEFMTSMVEAGYKNFNLDVQPDRTNEELRRQRDDLKGELRDARRRIERLEDQLHNTEREVILRYIEDNDGATDDEIVQKLIDTTRSRVANHLDMMEGEHVVERASGYYSIRDE